MAVQNNQIWTGLQSLPVFDLYAQLYLQPVDPIRANYTTIPYKNLQLGTFWLTTKTSAGGTQGNLWYLANLTLPPHVEGHWIQISGGAGNIGSFLTDNAVVVLPTADQVILQGGNNITTVGSNTPGKVIFNVSGTTNHCVQIGNASGSLTSVTNGTTGQVLTAQTGGDPIWTAITTEGAITIIHTDDGNNVTPTAGVINLVGAHGLNTTGTVGPNTATVAINNSITLGDLTPIAAGSPAITVDSGDIHFTASNLAATTNQMITFGVFPHLNVISFYCDNIFLGAQAGNTTLTPGVGIFNVGIGQFSGSSITTGHQNTALGNASLQALTTGLSNSVFGYTAGAAITTGSGNMAIGDGSLAGLVTGSNNIAIGFASGSAYNGAESGNILIGAGVSGLVGESNVTKIANIRGVTTTNNNAVAVLIDSAGQLGTISSSARYKDNIQTMNGASDAIHYLRPVTFNYKEDASKRTNYGLIAEEVAQVMPNLVVYDDMDEPETVRYLDLIPMLLNEIQKQRKLVMDLISHVGVLEQDVMKLKAKKKS